LNLKLLNNKNIKDITTQEMDTFYNIVVNDIKNENQTSSQVKDYLHDHANLWYYCLVLIRRDIELQLSCQKSKVQMHKNNIKNNTSEFPESEVLAYVNKQENWRMTAVKFLSKIERRMLYVKILMKS